MPATRIQLWPSLEGRLHNTSYDDPSRHLGHGPSIRLHQQDSCILALDNQRKNLQLYLSLVPYLKDLFYLHLA
jgi:hypothetical protein